MQSGIFLVRYRTKLMDAGMPMPALFCLMPMPSYGEKPSYFSLGPARREVLFFRLLFRQTLPRGLNTTLSQYSILIGLLQ
jgi:hypothetical protein